MAEPTLTPRKPLKLATRKSALALVQAETVRAALAPLGLPVDLVPITSRGDRDRRSVAQIDSQGIFTKALEDAILSGRCEAAVHSAKDMPTQLMAGLGLAAALPREDPRDCLVSRDNLKLSELPAGAIIGTSSPRRAAFILAERSDLDVRPIRGNVPTRLENAQNGQFDAVILAIAGLKRLSRENLITEPLESAIMLSAAGQGAIAIETRLESETARFFKNISDEPTFACISAERACLRALQAGCRTPVGILAVPEGREFLLQAEILLPDGSKKWRAEIRFRYGRENEAGCDVAKMLFSAGAPRPQ